jgi:dUTP pyrophosphatase
MIEVAFLPLPGSENLSYPTYMTAGAAGADCYAALDGPVVLGSLERALIPLGFSLQLPVGYEAQLRPRSGLALCEGITLLNSPGTIDADYRGPVGAILVNLSREAVTIGRGDRVAQIIIAPVAQAQWRVVETLDVTTRQAGGFGSTGRSGAAIG